MAGYYASHAWGSSGHVILVAKPILPGGTEVTVPNIPVNSFAKLDLKADDGRPRTGDYVIHNSGCSIGTTATAYDPNNRDMNCSYNIKLEI